MKIQGELPFVVDWQMKRGADWSKSIELESGGAVLNTAGYDAVMTVRASQNGEIYATISISSGQITNEPTDGRFDIRVTAATVDTYDFASAEHELQVTDAMGNKAILFIGRITVV